MPIKIVVQGNLHVPRVFCDHCDTEIIRGDDGNYEWADKAFPSNVYFTHKACSGPFREQNPEIDMHEELMVLPRRLSANLAIDPTKAIEADKMGNSV